VAGHARIEAAKLLNINAVPVDFQPFASTEEETAYLIADNRIAELAERDNAVLKDLLQELDSGANDMDLTGYTEQALEELMTQTHQDEAPEDFKDVDENIDTEHECPKCGYRWSGGQ
jgi:ParB-like chromosome segregation protein Spo0J